MSLSTLWKDTTPSVSSLVTGAIAAFTFFLLAKYIYRVTFHPLASFPGPKLAALTSLYGGLYDLHPNRSYCKQFPALHDRYGPIVRTWPNQLHIRDIESYNQIFRVGTKFNKDDAFYANPFIKGGYFNIASVKSALARKGMHSPLLSKEAVRRSEHLVTDMLIKFLNIVSGYTSEARPVDLNNGFRCLAADISWNFIFQRPLNALDAEGFESKVLSAVDAFTALFQWPIYFPRFFKGALWVIACLPRWFLNRFLTVFVLAYWCHEVSREQLVYLQNGHLSKTEIRTVFDINFHPNLEKGQFSPTIDEMTSDAFAYLTAGTDTTSFTLIIITWALVSNPQMMQKLKAELRAVMPGREDVVDCARLENLSYLRALVREGLRLSLGVPGRIPRVVPPTGAVLGGQKIPAGTVVSSCHYVYHQEPHVFQDPLTFQPERWLSDQNRELKDMDNNFIPFSRGSRSCIGMHLAYAELYLVLAHFYRRFEVSNMGTSAADMEWDDNFAPVTRGHLKVMVREGVD